MFDPAVYENLKVVLEGDIYDRDLMGEIAVISRKDIVDMASMSRTFEISFCLAEIPLWFVTINLYSGLNEFVDEKINSKEGVGCRIHVEFNMPIKDERSCEDIEVKLNNIWLNNPKMKKTISYDLESNENKYLKVLLDFKRKVTEEQIDDLAPMIETCVKSLEYIKI
jgi:hypothetical protein